MNQPSSGPPRRERIGRSVGFVFVLAVALYCGAYFTIEHLRTRKGGWQVIFRSDAAGAPAVTIAQPFLGISNVNLVFPDQHVSSSNLTRTLVFDQPITNVPFGRMVYLDTTFLPGSIVLDAFDHQIQLLPRVMLIDGREHPWRSGDTIALPRPPGRAETPPEPSQR